MKFKEVPEKHGFHLFTAKFWLQEMVTTEGKGSCGQVLADI